MNFYLRKKIRIKPRVGFTLVELLIVIAIIFILTMLALPDVREIYEKIETEREIKNIVTFLRYAQERVARELVPKTVVRVYPDENKFTLRYLKKDEVLKKLKIPSEFKIESQTARVTFDSFGAIYIADKEEDVYLMNAAIDVYDESGRKYQIKIYNTGYINFKRID